MRLSVGIRIRNKLKSLSFISLLMHATFFWIRLSCVAIIIFRPWKAHFPEICVDVLKQAKFRSEIWNAIVFLSNFNLFQFYQEISALASGNIYGYYLSIATMIHNAVLAVFIPVTAGVRLPAIYLITFTVFSLTFVAETVLSLYLMHLRRFEDNLEIFKKIGANPIVNNAFATRKLLQTFGASNVFLSLVILGRDAIPPETIFDWMTISIIWFVVLTCIQQLLVSVNFNDENMAQRKAAIVLSIVRMPLIIVIAVCCAVKPKGPGQIVSTYLAAFIFTDIMVISLVFNYVLLNDTWKFGSGLKGYLLFRTEKLDLSSCSR